MPEPNAESSEPPEQPQPAEPARKKPLGTVRLVFRALLLLIVAFVVCLTGMITCMPGKSYRGPLPPLSRAEAALRDELQRDVYTLAGEIGNRNVFEQVNLAASAEWIEGELEQAGYVVERQTYDVTGVPCHNLIVEIRGRERPEEILVVGAHYDSVIGCPAANDNGSAVAAMLALARRLAGRPLQRTLRFVAFVNEEPPFFQTDEMGSLVYAKRCRERDEKIIGMLSLETMGYYSDEPGSQHYPPPFSLLYPSTGDFITFVGNLRSRKFVRQVVGSFRRHAQFPSQGGAIPSLITQVGWSDHWSFWQMGYPGLMVTDTALFRYPYYHTSQDTPEKLDYERLARVVAGMERVVTELAGE